jgi:hypothetical protein
VNVLVEMELITGDAGGVDDLPEDMLEDMHDDLSVSRFLEYRQKTISCLFSCDSR